MSSWIFASLHLSSPLILHPLPLLARSPAQLFRLSYPFLIPPSRFFARSMAFRSCSAARNCPKCILSLNCHFAASKRFTSSKPVIAVTSLLNHTRKQTLGHPSYIDPIVWKLWRHRVSIPLLSYRTYVHPHGPRPFSVTVERGNLEYKE